MPQEAKAAADDVSPPPKASPEVLNVGKPGYFSRRRILGPVDKEYGDAVLLVHSFVTGLVDAASFANWGVFVGMQTGRFFESVPLYTSKIQPTGTRESNLSKQ